MSRDYICEDCGGEPSCPNIEDSLWDEIAYRDTLLCTHCAERRLRRRIQIADLKKVPVNHFTFIHDERLRRSITSGDE